MADSGGNYRTSRNGRRKRFPVFSVVLVACYLVVSVWFFLYGLGEGTKSDPDEAPGGQAPPETAAPPVRTPDINTFYLYGRGQRDGFIHKRFGI